LGCPCECTVLYPLNRRMLNAGLPDCSCHVFVSARPGAVQWLEKVWDSSPVTEDHEMSLFIFSSTQLVINDVDEDIPSTIAFTSDDCDRDFQRVIGKGAVSVDEPKDMPWGVRAGFVQGPGKLTFEIEQPLEMNF